MSSFVTLYFKYCYTELISIRTLIYTLIITANNYKTIYYLMQMYAIRNLTPTLEYVGVALFYRLFILTTALLYIIIYYSRSLRDNVEIRRR